MSKYTYELKKQVVEKYFEGYSAIDLANDYNLSHRRRVYEWVEKVREGGYEALSDFRKLRKNRRKSNGNPIDELERLRLENEYLKKLLDLKRR